MSEFDPLLSDTVGTLLAADLDALIELVADGVMWRGTPIAGATWARTLPRPAGGRAGLQDRLAISGYLHLERACYRVGERWVPAGSVRMRLESVSVWRLHATAAVGITGPATRVAAADAPGAADPAGTDAAEAVGAAGRVGAGAAEAVAAAGPVGAGAARVAGAGRSVEVVDGTGRADRADAHRRDARPAGARGPRTPATVGRVLP